MELFVFVEPQPAYADYAATRADPTMVDCADAGGWLRRIPDGTVERMLPLLRSLLRPKGADLATVEMAREVAERLLVTALGEGT